MLKDYYAILGVIPRAEDVVIRAAFKALAQRYHPDRNADRAETEKKMAELNEAYAVLSDPEKRRNYDASRVEQAQEGHSYFAEEEDSPPVFDPLEKDWAIAIKYYTDLPSIEQKLSRIAWRLAYSFRAYLLSEKMFEHRREIARSMEQEFLESYFGTNPKVVNFARELIGANQKKELRELNEAVRVLGSSVDPDRIIDKLQGQIDKTQRKSWPKLSPREPGQSIGEWRDYIIDTFKVKQEGDIYVWDSLRFASFDDLIVVLKNLPEQ